MPCLTTCRTLTHPIQEKASYKTLRWLPVAIKDNKKSYGLKTDEFQLYVHATLQKLLTTKWKWNTATDNAHLKDALSMSDVEAHCYLWDVVYLLPLCNSLAIWYPFWQYVQQDDNIRHSGTNRIYLVFLDILDVTRASIPGEKQETLHHLTSQSKYFPCSMD